MEWILAHWAYITIGILVIDKVVALTPTKQDDLLWTSVKAALRVVLPGKLKVIAPFLLFVPSLCFAASEVDVGFSTSSGTVDKQQMILEVTRVDDNTKVQGQFQYTETEGDRIEEKGMVRGEYNEELNSEWTIWSYEQVGYDIAREIRTENFLGSGPKYTIFSDDDIDVSFSFGVLNHWVAYDDGTEDTLYRESFRLKFAGEWEGWRVGAWGSYQPVVSDYGDYILHGRASLRLAITEEIGVKVTIEDEHRSMSAGEKNTLKTILALSMGF